MEVPEYTDYLDDVSAVVVRLNAQHANVETGWQPIHLILGENYPRALAAMKRYDVLLVNTIIDGMNLVAKEGVLLNDRNGVLILSEGAGAVQQLGDHALIISPADVEGTADAIYQALTMSPGERRRRADNLRRTVESDDVAKWFREQLWDVVRYAIRKEHDPGSALPDGSLAGDADSGIDSGQDRLHVIISPIASDQNGNTT
jgi:trehalose 6-phosphate synthase